MCIKREKTVLLQQAAVTTRAKARLGFACKQKMACFCEGDLKSGKDKDATREREAKAAASIQAKAPAHKGVRRNSQRLHAATVRG
eukprot:5122569-Pleurochrysis_carterae.AAC.1